MKFLHQDGKHLCAVLPNLPQSGAIPANPFLLMDGEHIAILDPGGDLSFEPLFQSLTEFNERFSLENVEYLIASHQDPDVFPSAVKWLVMCAKSKLVIPQAWSRFVPHAFRRGVDTSRLISVPEVGARIPFGTSELWLINAPFLHSTGNMQVYDPTSKILFSGDLGASTGAALTGPQGYGPVQDFESHRSLMEPFHQRYMASNKALRFWIQLVRTLDISMIVPQHGTYFEGPEMIERFLSWLEPLPCGLDLLTQQDYRIPPPRS